MVSHFKRRHLVSVILCQFLFNWSLSSAALSNLDLRSSVSSGNYVYVHQTIVIICTTTNTHYLAWRSDEYIGQGQQLIFNSTLPPGYSRMSAMGAIATLIRIQDGNGDLSLQSRLEISVSSNFGRSSVTCENVDLASTDTVSWITRDQPATLLNQSNPNILACAGEYLHFDCLVRDSSAIHWIILGPPDIKVNCTTSVNGSSNTKTSTVVTRDRHSFTNGTVELVCSLQFIATLSQTSVTCLNSEIGVNRTIYFHVQDCDSPVPTSNGNNANTGNNAMTDAKDTKESMLIGIPIWSVVVITVAGVAVILFIIIMSMIIYRRARKRRNSVSGNKNELDMHTEDVVQPD